MSPLRPTLAAFVLTSLGSLHAAVTLPPIFSDHMVLQKGKSTPVWGVAKPGEEVTISILDQKATAKAGADGKWMAHLDLSNAAATPTEMNVAGENQIKITDVLIGEVWLASGQSNMSFALGRDRDAQTEIPNSANPLLREFTAVKATSDVPVGTLAGRWSVAGPKTVSSFSAVAYYYGKTLQKTLQVPVGIVSSNWGGTPAESWMSKESMDADPLMAQRRAGYQKKLEDYNSVHQAYVDGLNKWLASTDRKDRPAKAAEFADPAVATTDWLPLSLPGSLVSDKLAPAGAVWLRTNVNISPKLAEAPVFIDIKAFDGFESIYWNGTLVSTLTPETLGDSKTRRRYPVPTSLVKTGTNTLAIRIYNPTGFTTFDKPSLGPIPVPPAWFAKVEYPLPAADAAAVAALPKPPAETIAPQRTATYLFNGMIAPIIPYGMRGAIWYQGEGNAPRAYQYRDTLTAMIKDWRARWGEGDFPFYLCQLANFMPKDTEPKESAWAELREAQSQIAKIPNSGYAVLIDLGEAGDIHPRDKKDAGERLAQVALANTYGKDVPFAGPTYESMAKEDGGKIRIKFKHAEGLVAKPLPETYIVNYVHNSPTVKNAPNSELEGFTICGEDKKWVWANAKVDGDSVIVSADGVAAPVAVRYAWANNPNTNLYNAAGLPAAPFRTDDFPLSTAGKKKDAADTGE